MRCAVIVTTYNRADALAAVLRGYLAQDDPQFELIVGDDGSTADTRSVVDEYGSRANFPVRHVWQEDRGFRAAAARNRALAATDAEYVIFTDGDCIPSRYFVSAHRRLAERGCFLSGSRILLSEGFTREVLDGLRPVQQWNGARWVECWLRGGINRWLPLPLLRLPDGGFRKHSARQWQGVKTCNLSAWREDLLQVNGLDEAYCGWGLEDSDLVIRLLHAGVRHKSARFAAPVFHLWHPENDRSRLPENQRKLEQLLHSGRVRAEIGLDRYVSSSVPG